ncbi:four helix bundle protein [Zunongwangia sp. F260]|uniref:Four helix bundle protein n=1 Tax=Autumnicola lenta TaxID=3075593 RepID=A0ABU3CLF2_9FLAO|nr:four helix bundle protein [Zunongwangia sp. F260]MDT0647178.1 four helix bundle protein [Zunongwangia sp. F260]
MRDDRKNIIVDKTFEFALKVIKFSEELRENKKFELASQFFKCGTSIGANVREAQNAESPADFIHKFKIAAKEADECAYWLELCQKSELLPDPPEALKVEIDSIIRIISKIISSSKRIGK